MWRRLFDVYIPRLVTEHRLISMLGVAIVTVVFASQLPDVQADFSPQSLFATSEDNKELTEKFTETFGKTESVVTVFVRRDDVFHQPTLQYLHELSQYLSNQPWAAQVQGLTTTAYPRSGGNNTIEVGDIVEGDTVSADEVEELRKTAVDSELLRGSLVSADGTIAATAAMVKGDYVRISDIREIVQGVQQWIDSHQPPEGTEVIHTGIPELRYAVVHQMFKDQIRLVPIALAISLLVLYLCFHWLPAMIIPNLGVLLTIVIVTGGMALADEPFNMVNQILPILVLVIGISDSIHLVNRYGEELRASGSRKEAAANMVRRMALACLLTSCTTAVGFASLIVARTDILRGFGIAAALAMLAAYIVTIVLLPSLLTLFSAPNQQRFISHDGLLERITVGCVSWVLHHTKSVLVVSGLIVVCAVGIASTVTVDSNLLDVLSAKHPTIQKLRLSEEKMQGLIPVEVSITSSEQGRFHDPEVLNAMDALADWVERQPGVLRTQTYGDYLHEVWAVYTGEESKRVAPFESRAQIAQLYSLIEGANPDPTEAYVNANRTHARLQIQIRDVGGQATLALVERLRGVADEEFRGLENIRYHVTGDGYTAAKGVNFILRDMMSSLGLAFVIIFIIMSLLFRSVRMGLISVPPNIIPLVLTLGYMAIRGIYLNSTTAIIFSISLGLAVDDTIHFLARFREETLLHGQKEKSILAAAGGTGRAILVTTFMLASGQAVLLWSSFVPLTVFAELIVVTLVGCVFGDLIVLPALLKVAWKPTGSSGLFEPTEATADKEGCSEQL